MRLLFTPRDVLNLKSRKFLIRYSWLAPRFSW
jgi:hypothetical protein